MKIFIEVLHIPFNKKYIVEVTEDSYLDEGSDGMELDAMYMSSTTQRAWGNGTFVLSQYKFVRIMRSIYE